MCLLENKMGNITVAHFVQTFFPLAQMTDTVVLKRRKDTTNILNNN
jgi:hypothetical protein